VIESEAIAVRWVVCPKKVSELQWNCIEQTIKMLSLFLQTISLFKGTSQDQFSNALMSNNLPQAGGKFHEGLVKFNQSIGVVTNFTQIFLG